MFKLLAFAFIMVAVNAAPAPAPHGYIAAPVSYSYQSQVVHHPAPVVKTYVAAHPAPIVPVVHHPAPLIKTYPAYVPTYEHSLYPLAYKAPLVYAPHY